MEDFGEDDVENPAFLGARDGQVDARGFDGPGGALGDEALLADDGLGPPIGRYLNGLADVQQAGVAQPCQFAQDAGPVQLLQ